MLLPASALLAGLLSGIPLAHAQDEDAPAPPDPMVVEGINLREISSCAAVLPPPPPPPPAEEDATAKAKAKAKAKAAAAPEVEAPKIDPLCEGVPESRRCIAPRPSLSSAGRANRYVPLEEQEEPPPPPAPPPSHKTGISHVFDWLKALNTCRFQARTALPRPTEPIKGEFESDASFKKRMADYTSQMAARETRADRLYAKIDPLVGDATFALILPAKNIGEYDPDSGCFFPGAEARAELDDFKSRDTIYRREGTETEKYRLIPRDEPLRVRVTSDTIKEVRLDPDTPRTVLQITSHPICVSPEVGRIMREQKERNAIADYGVQAELQLVFSVTDGQPVWEVRGDFVYRGAADLVEQPEDTAAPRIEVERTLTVRPAADPPAVVTGPGEGSGVPGPPKKSALGCAAAGRSGASLLLASLLGLLLSTRSRRRPTTR